jgi:hypothetical protein
MKYVHPRALYTAVLPEYLLVRIDILQILLQTGCSLSVFYKIINWLQHFP